MNSENLLFFKCVDQFLMWSVVKEKHGSKRTYIRRQNMLIKFYFLYFYIERCHWQSKRAENWNLKVVGNYVCLALNHPSKRLSSTSCDLSQVPSISCSSARSDSGDTSLPFLPCLETRAKRCRHRSPSGRTGHLRA